MYYLSASYHYNTRRCTGYSRLCSPLTTLSPQLTENPTASRLPRAINQSFFLLFFFSDNRHCRIVSVVVVVLLPYNSRVYNTRRRRWRFDRMAKCARRGMIATLRDVPSLARTCCRTEHCIRIARDNLFCRRRRLQIKIYIKKTIYIYVYKYVIIVRHCRFFKSKYKS